MRLIIDNANVSDIKRLYDVYPIDGVTTNPSILAKTGRKPYDVLKAIRELVGPDGELHAQAISRKAEDIIREAEFIREKLGSATYIKIPAIPEGIKAIKELSKVGCRITATAVYTPLQALVAAKAGADYVAPYVNRIDNLGGSGVETVGEIKEIFENNGIKTMILAASFKNANQVKEICRMGIDAVTLQPELIDSLLKNDSVEAAVDRFISDFEVLCGSGATMIQN
ncbi:MAG: fructose-6-phosphate aldolase [Lachnospiraceae bacterium]|nr:fructose-6-phosphate aldolase [Lachnospiraceae bacterium]MBR6270597.1 fructose-6-phosphate aldolase [Lachnospiraceae bacterium]